MPRIASTLLSFRSLASPCLAERAVKLLCCQDQTAKLRCLPWSPKDGETREISGSERRQEMLVLQLTVYKSGSLKLRRTLVLQERTRTVRCLLHHMQKRLQQTETYVTLLEARNRLLECICSSQLRPTAGPSTSTGSSCLEVHHTRLGNHAFCAEFLFVQDLSRGPASNTAPQVLKGLLAPGVRITTRSGKVCSMTPCDVAQMPLESYAALYTVSLSLSCC